MATRAAILVTAAALALGGCTTSGLASRTSSSTQAASGCYEAANGRLEARKGIALCDKAVADRGMAVAQRAATLVNRGILLMQADAFDTALKDFDAAIAAAPDLADAYINKGVVLLHIGGREAEAVTVLTAALERGPKRPELVYYHRAGAYEALGQLRDAYDDYAEAAQLAPDWAEPANQLQRFKFVRRKTLTG